LARSFLREDLGDEIFIGIVPALLGDGIPSFTLIECKSHSNGSVALRYSPHCPSRDGKKR
jgi:hypothetical protein